MATTHPHPGFLHLSRSRSHDEHVRVDLPPSFLPAEAEDDADGDGWKTSTAPTALAVGLLTALATALAVGLREVVSLASAILGA